MTRIDLLTETAHDSLDHTGIPGVGGEGGGLSTGTEFPAEPSTGDRFRRSDLDYTVWYYDGTRWLSEQMFTLSFAPSPEGGQTTTDAEYGRMPLPLDFDTWWVKWDLVMRMSTPGSSSWTVGLDVLDFEDDHTSLDTVTNAAPGDTNWRHFTEDIGTLVASATGNSANAPTHICLNVVENSGAEGMHFGAVAYYRYAITPA